MARPPEPDSFTKSIPLAGGVQDDVPEFVQAAPTLAYVENGRFHRNNEIEKALPESDMTPSSPGTGDPLLIESAGTALLAIGSTESHEYIEAWRELNSEARIASLEKHFSSSAAGGACHFSWARNIVNGTVIAYETRASSNDDSDGSAGSFTVIIERFSYLGDFISRETIFGARAPQVSETSSIRVIVHYIDTAHYLRVKNPLLDTDDAVLDSGVPIRVFFGCTAFDAITSSTSTIPLRETTPTVTLDNNSYNGVRAGFDINGQCSWYHVDYFGTGDGILLYQDFSTHVIYAAVLDIFGQVGTNPSELVQFATAQTSPTQYRPMACATSSASGIDRKFWIVTTTRSASSRNSSLRYRRYNSDLSTTEIDVDPVDQDFETIVNATVTPVGTAAYVAYTRVLGEETTVNRGYNTLTAIKYGNITLGGGYTNFGTIPDHRLTSNIALYGSEFVFSCEQFAVLEAWQNPADPGKTESYDVTDTPKPGIKPVSNILVRADINGNYYPLAVFDAGTSKHTNLSMQEQNPWVGRLKADGDTYLYLNRQMLQGEDFSIMVRFPNNEAPTKDKTSWQGGEYRSNMYIVNMKPDKLVASVYGESVIINSAIPLWYAGGTLGELSVLEQPEILGIDTGGTGDQTIFAQSYSSELEPVTDSTTGDTAWMQYSVVIGYTDNKGHVHRSAPSFPVFVIGATPSQTNEEYIHLSYTQPLSCYSSEYNYFVEVYAANLGDTPQLAHAQQVEREATAATQVIFRNMQLIGAGGGIFLPVRASEVLYTEGGVAPADPWPAFTDSVITSRRMFTIEGSTLYFSKLFEENIAPEHSAVLTVPFGRSRTLTAIGKIDDKVIIFEKNTIHALYGDGPDNTGSGQGFLLDHLQTTAGCSDPESVVEVPEGLLFYDGASQEFHLIDRDLNIVDIGRPVFDLSEGIDVISATVFPAEHEVRWYVTPGSQPEYGPDPDTGAGVPTRPPRPRFKNVLPDNPVITFNYVYGKWGVLSDKPTISTTVHDDKMVRLQADWTVTTTSTEWSLSDLMTYRSTWIPVQELQNFGRIRNVVLLGKYLSAWKDNGNGHEAGDIKITTRYDYEADGEYHEHLWKANEDLNPIYGERLQFSFKPGRPKCQAIQITVEEVPTQKLDAGEPDYTNGRGFVISGLDLVYSLKRGLGSKSIGQPRSK